MSKVLLETSQSELLSYISKEFHKSAEDLDELIKLLGDWAKEQPHFPEIPARYVLQFVLLYNKFSIEKAKQKLDMYYTIRTLVPEAFNKSPLAPEIVVHSKVIYILPLPKVFQGYKRIIYSRINPDLPPEMFSSDKVMIQFYGLLELLILEDTCSSFDIIFDIQHMQLGHVARFNPMMIKKVSFILESVYSNRVASIRIVNFQPLMEHLVNNIIKPFLKPKIKDRLSVHTGNKILLEVFGKSHLPKDVGGDQPALDEIHGMLMKKFEERKDRFDKLLTLKVDESLRPVKLVNDEILGYYGSFRKINVD